MLRLTLKTPAGVSQRLDRDAPTAWLVDDEGHVAAEGHVIAAADTNLGDQQMIVGLQFIGEGTLGRGTDA